jgi:hypothetical protein
LRKEARETDQRTRPELSLPRLVLRLGVIGQRKLSESSRIDAALADVFNAIAAILTDIRAGSGLYLDTTPNLRVISALADGADQIAATAAMAAKRAQADQKTVGIELHCIIPVAPEIYRATIEERVRFTALSAAAESLLILDGAYDADMHGSEGQHHGSYVRRLSRKKAYRAVAWFTRRQSDLLLVLWDPTQEGRAGGTEESLREALQSGVSAIWINPAEASAIRIIKREDDLFIPPMSAREWRDVLRGELDRLLLPAETADKTGHSAFTQQHRLAEFMGGKRPARTVRQALWSLLMRWAEARFEPSAGWTWNRSEPVAFFEVYRFRATELSRYYAGLYRGAFLLNYFVGFSAILIAALSHALYDAIRLNWLIASLGGLELVAISFILWNTHRAHHGEWHECSIDYRFLAELFRTMNYLAPLGCGEPRAHGWMQYAGYNPQQTWMYWLFRSVVRQAPAVLPAFASTRELRFDQYYVDDCLGRITKDWIPSQHLHHQRTAAAMGRIFDLIEWAGRKLFIAALLAVAVHFAIDVSQLASQEEWLKRYDEAFEPWLAFLATVLPAAVLAANGFRFQAESRRTRQRSMSMATQLEKDLIAFGRLDAASIDGCRSWDVARKTLMLAEKMVDEVADWRIVHHMHEVSAA